jgi:hypothetical protein
MTGAVDPVKVGLAGLAIGVALAIRLLAPVGWDASAVGAFGEDSPEITTYAERRLGRQVVTRDALGHDGKFFFIQGNDPWYLQPGEHAVWLDRPFYRAQRMLYPVLASAGGLAGPEAVLWGMLAVNVAALGVGAGLAGSLARAHGASAWWGLAFPLNLGMIDEFGIGGAGIVAFAAAIGAVILVERDRTVVAAAVMSAAVLAREAMLVLAVGVAIGEWLRRRRGPVAVVLVPAVAALVWAVYLVRRLPAGSDIDQVIGLPLVGVLQAFGTWGALDWAVMTVWLILSLSLTVRAIRHPTALAWGGVGFVALALLFTWQVWLNFYDLSRATAPVFTAWVFATFVDSSVHRQAAPTA